MEILYTNCAGLDVHKKTVKVCLFTQTPQGQPHKEFRTYLTTTEELLKLSDWLKDQGCTHIAWRGQRGCIGNRCSTCWKAVLNS
jgi:transposase